MMDFLDVKRDDLNYAHLYGDNRTLMANAARQLSDFVRTRVPKGSRICAVCGTGNNAGDGIAALENLREDYEVIAVLIKGKASLKTEEARWAKETYKGRLLGLESMEEEVKAADLVLDCMFGIGISGEPREPYAHAIEIINSLGKEVVSVDVPSGMGTKHAVIPQYTVTFTDQKKGMDSSNSGEIIVVDIGIPEEVREYAGPGDVVYYTRPDPASHKGMNGSLSIIGGWEYYGSSVIAGLGANRIGNDLVKIYTPSGNYGAIASYSPNLIVRNITTMGETWQDDALRGTALLIGPGIGDSKLARDTTNHLIEKSQVPVVVDADGIRIVSGNLKSFSGKQLVFTPHRKEFEVLTGTSATEGNAISFASKHSVTIVMKGMTDIVTDGNRTIKVRGGNARMSMGGTGDLLAGLVAALASRGISPFRAAVMGAYINKKIAEAAYRKKSYWYGIDDMIDSIPEFMKTHVTWAAGEKSTN